ncbi:MAG: hypothetical protein GXO36_02865 [Chloroflexi bacterium]|nr:hypothetical protein [Chloroflexota bacterium]
MSSWRQRWHRRLRAWPLHLQRYWLWQRWLSTRVGLIFGLFLLVVLAHLYLANRAVVLWEDIRTMQYESWRMSWEIATMQTELARRTSAHELEAIQKETSLRWPLPDEVTFLPAPIPTEAGPPRLPVLWPNAHPLARSLPPAYTVTLGDVIRWWWQNERPWETTSPGVEEGP